MGRLDRRERFSLLTKLSLYECEGFVYNAKSRGGSFPLLKILLSTYCERNCSYCMFRRDREETPRVFIEPEELAEGFYSLYRKGVVRGLFLSSGVFNHPEITMEKMIETVWILRRKYDFSGYVHLKIMPEVSLQTIEEAVKLSDRVSINIEAPTEERLRSIAKGKSLLRDMVPKMRKITEMLREYRDKDQTTQVMVGASGETDRELLRTSEYLYRKLKLRRVYYSGFRPVRNTPMENLPSCPQDRIRRLYQADALIRYYGFSAEDILAGRDFLDPSKDPKEIWVERNRDMFPVEINEADPELLIRIPGVGPKTLRKILNRRSISRIRSPRDLRGIGNLRKILRYVLLDGRYYGSAPQGRGSGRSKDQHPLPLNF